jgi:hypothetical protein
VENNQQNADRALVQFCLQLGDELCNLWQYHLYYHGWYKTKFKTEKDRIRNQKIKVRGRISIGDNSKELDNKILHIDKKTAGYYPRKGFQEDNEFWVELMKGFVKNPQQWYESIKIAPGMDIENATVNLSLASFLQATYFTSIANLIENGELKDDIHWKMGFVFRRLEHANQIRSKSDQLFGYMRAKKQEKNRNLKNVSRRTVEKKRTSR